MEAEICEACGYPPNEHNEEDRATCAEVLREIDEDAAEAAKRGDENARLWVLARSVGK